MKLSSIIISLLIHAFILSLKFYFTTSKKYKNIKNKKIEEKIIKISLKTLKNKKIIELNNYNDSVDPESKYISFKDNFSNNKYVSAESLLNKKQIKDSILINQQSKSEFENKKISEGVNSEKSDISTTKFAYFDYYKKMKKIVDIHFSSLLKEKNIEDFLDENISETYILLKINSKGDILSKKIDKSSGYIAVDFVALESFNNIKLPPPPLELLNNKEFVFIQWGFSLK